MTAAVLLNFLGLAEENGASPRYQPGESAGKRRSGPGTSQAASVEQSALHARRDSEQLLNQIRTSKALTSTPTSPAAQTVDRVLAANLVEVIAAMPDAIHEAMRKTLPHKYTPDLADAIASQTIASLTGVTSAPCPAFRDCADTTPGHYDHFTPDTKVVDDADGSTILDAGMVANSGSDRHVIVYLRNAEFTDPASVRAKTAEVRAFLDQVDELADRVFADHQARTEATA